MTVSQLEEARHEVENQYSRAVRREGNRSAQKTIAEVFEVTPREWRGLGEIPASGFQLRGRFQKYDANRRFPFTGIPAHESPECISGLILQGIKKPHDCPRIRREVYARKSAGRAHGIVGGRVRGLLSLWQTSNNPVQPELSQSRESLTTASSSRTAAADA